MSVKKVLAKKIQELLKRYRQKKRRQRFQNQVARLIEDSSAPALSKQDQDRILAYWQSFGYSISTEWHRYYLHKTGKLDPAFIPDETFYVDLKDKMNDLRFAGAWSDKAYLDRFLTGVKTPYNVLRNTSGRYLDHDFRLLSFSEAQALLNQEGSVVIKPASFTDTGKGVKLLRTPVDLKTIENDYKNNFVIQRPLEQIEDMKRLNSSSINTVRFNTVLLDTKAHVMSAFVKVGQAGEFADNSGHDRFFIGIRKDGTFADYAIDHDYNLYETIPSGFAFAGQKLPAYERACDAVIRAHECVPHFGFAFWDVCIDKDGNPVIVEMNLREPNTYVPQIASGPFFGEYTEDVLKYIGRRG